MDSVEFFHPPKGLHNNKKPHRPYVIHCYVVRLDALDQGVDAGFHDSHLRFTRVRFLPLILKIFNLVTEGVVVFPRFELAGGKRVDVM